MIINCLFILHAVQFEKLPCRLLSFSRIFVIWIDFQRTWGTQQPLQLCLCTFVYVKHSGGAGNQRGIYQCHLSPHKHQILFLQTSASGSTFVGSSKSGLLPYFFYEILNFWHCSHLITYFFTSLKIFSMWNVYVSWLAYLHILGVQGSHNTKQKHVCEGPVVDTFPCHEANLCSKIFVLFHVLLDFLHVWITQLKVYNAFIVDGKI